VAGDWIKMRGNLWDDPRVAKLCDLTGKAEATVIGALYWLWATADQHSADGELPGLTAAQIDRKTGVKGFGRALIAVGWLAEDDEGVTIARFGEHNGASAKQRALTAKRVADHKQRGAKGNATVTAASLANNDVTVSSALPREEKRREEEKNSVGNSEQGSAQPSPAGLLSRALRDKGVLSNPMDPRLIALAEAGCTPEQAGAAAQEAIDAKGANARIPPAYVFAILERWRAQPASMPATLHDPNAAAAEALRMLEQRHAEARPG
jgi:hypothetical protein